MFEQKILALYKKNIFTRFDELDYLYYFSEKDFEGLKSENYEFYSYKGHIFATLRSRCRVREAV